MTTDPNKLILLAALAPAIPAAAQIGAIGGYDDNDINVRTPVDDDDGYGGIDYDEEQMNQAMGLKVKAEEQIEDATRRVRATWRADPEYVETKTQLDDLQRQVNEDRRAVRDRLAEENPDYAELRQLAEELDQKIDRIDALEKAGLNADGSRPVDTDTEEARAPEDPNAGGAGTGGFNIDLDEEDADAYKDDPQVDPERFRLAQAQVQTEARLAEIEEQAYPDRPGFEEKMAQLEDLRLKMKKQQAELDEMLYQDPGFKQAQDNLARAKAQIAAAGR